MPTLRQKVDVFCKDSGAEVAATDKLRAQIKDLKTNLQSVKAEHKKELKAVKDAAKTQKVKAAPQNTTRRAKLTEEQKGQRKREKEVTRELKLAEKLREKEAVRAQKLAEKLREKEAVRAQKLVEKAAKAAEKAAKPKTPRVKPTMPAAEPAEPMMPGPVAAPSLAPARGGRRTLRRRPTMRW